MHISAKQKGIKSLANRHKYFRLKGKRCCRSRLIIIIIVESTGLKIRQIIETNRQRLHKKSQVKMRKCNRSRGFQNSTLYSIIIKEKQHFVQISKLATKQNLHRNHLQASEVSSCLKWNLLVKLNLNDV